MSRYYIKSHINSLRVDYKVLAKLSAQPYHCEASPINTQKYRGWNSTTNLTVTKTGLLKITFFRTASSKNLKWFLTNNGDAT